MDITDAKNRLLKEIKVNSPIPTFEMWDKLKLSIYNIMESQSSNIFKEEYFSIISKITNGWGLNWNELSNVEKVQLYSQMKKLLNKYSINEELGDFKLGQSKSTSTGKHTITDMDDTTGSVTWKISKDLDEEEIYNDLTKIIEKLDKIKINKFHKNTKAYQLTKDLKTIRNKLSRTIVKEDKQHLIKTLKGILNEIKVNNPNIVNINN
jgi:hypothetical protein